MASRRRGFGAIRRLPSKRYQASYTGPDGARHSGPSTFYAAMDAEAWLAGERQLIAAGLWTLPATRTTAAEIADTKVFGTYAEAWLRDRDLKPRTRAHYRSLLDRQILPTFAHAPLASITPDSIRVWHAHLDAKKPTLRTHAYGLMRTIMGTALQDQAISANPCHIRGAGSAKRVKPIKPATLTELETLVAEMPQRYKLMILMASWCVLRFGELVELRRKDIDLTNEVIRVRRGAVRIKGEVIIGDPKSEAGSRDVTIPPHLMPFVRAHLETNVASGRDGLLFPAADGVSTLAPSTLYRVYYKARAAAGREDLRFHDLRHTGAVLAAQTGATLAELMSRGGWSTSAAAMRYQHAAKERDKEIASKLSAIATGVQE